MALVLLLLLLGALFAFVDTWYFLRFLWRRLSYELSKKEVVMREFLDPYVCQGIVLPSDIDFMLHMNNSKYLREMDFGRVGLGLEKGLHGAIVKLGGAIVLAAASIRFRRSLLVFQRFTLSTRILCWDERNVYMEQRMMSSDGFVCAINLAKMVVQRTTITEMLREMAGGSGAAIESPTPPPEVASWIESMKRSSEALKREVEEEGGMAGGLGSVSGKPQHRTQSKPLTAKDD